MRGFNGRGDVHGCGEGIVRRLPHVDMVVRVNRLFAAFFAAQQFDGAVGNHLIHIHIGLCARTRLPHHQWKLVIPLACLNFLRHAHNGIGHCCIQLAHLHIHLGRRLLDDGQSMD